MAESYMKSSDKIADMSSKTDIISRLPDEMLIEILSYVRTKSAVATSVLSKRWNSVWISVPVIDFSCDSDYFSRTTVQQAHLNNFVDRVLSLNKVSCLRKIHLSFYEFYDSLRTSRWISSIATRESKDIHLELPRWFLVGSLARSSDIYQLPDRFFTSKHLVTLSLKRGALKVPTLVSFPCLKTIHLILVKFLDQVSMKNLLFGCQILDLLSIDRPSWDNADTLHICSSTLQDLMLCTQDCGRDFGYNVVIDAPKLRDFTLSDQIGVAYDIVNLTSLVKVKVDIELNEEELEDVEDFNLRLLVLLIKFSHVEDIHFTTATMRSFMYANDEMPTFHNLTRMKVDICDESGSTLDSYLFECAPNLVTFVLQINGTELYHAWYAPNEVPQCFLSSLEFVEIKSFNVCDNEMRLINYILKHALVLKKLVISCSFDCDDLEEEMKIISKLFSIPRSSRFCQIEYKNSVSEY